MVVVILATQLKDQLLSLYTLRGTTSFESEQVAATEEVQRLSLFVPSSVLTSPSHNCRRSRALLTLIAFARGRVHGGYNNQKSTHTGASIMMGELQACLELVFFCLQIMKTERSHNNN